MNQTIPKTKVYALAKCLTAILVVIAHATRMYTPSGAIAVSGESGLLNHLTTYIYAFHMPLFIMLSGCVYGYCIEQQKYNNAPSFLLNKGRKLLLPYLMFGLLYVAPTMCALKLANHGYMSYAIRGILLSLNSRHLWYLMALFWIFLVYYGLKPLLLRGNWGLVIVGCISFLLHKCSVFFPDTFQISAACNQQIFFFLGIVFNRYYTQIAQVFQKYHLAGLALPFLLLCRLFYNPNTATANIYAVIGITMVLLLCWYLLYRFPAIVNTGFYLSFKKDTFGLYLFHPMIIYVLFYWLGRYPIPPFVLAAFISVIATILSIYATKAIRAMGLQWMVGE